ncbi:MAG: hypothetical protein BWY81_00282 [Firmicutes bacterium ADurb.Bin467]|nr:MAG: hypothetical protein BWY81_00282 [Firmicutes bacterium ADurb.Bin467]
MQGSAKFEASPDSASRSPGSIFSRSRARNCASISGVGLGPFSATSVASRVAVSTRSRLTRLSPESEETNSAETPLSRSISTMRSPFFPNAKPNAREVVPIACKFSETCVPLPPIVTAFDAMRFVMLRTNLSR